MQLKCCNIGCLADAEFVIATRRRSGGPAGPDPYSDDTHACALCVGTLLGHQPDAAMPSDIEWIVSPIFSGNPAAPPPPKSRPDPLEFATSQVMVMAEKLKTFGGRPGDATLDDRFVLDRACDIWLRMQDILSAPGVLHALDTGLDWRAEVKRHLLEHQECYGQGLRPVDRGYYEELRQSMAESSVGVDWRDEVRQQMAAQQFQAEEQAKLQEQMAEASVRQQQMAKLDRMMDGRSESGRIPPDVSGVLAINAVVDQLPERLQLVPPDRLRGVIAKIEEAITEAIPDEPRTVPRTPFD